MRPLSQSALKIFVESPRDYYEIYIAKTKERDPPNDAMRLGSLTHRMVLQPGTERTEFRKLPAYIKSRRGKVYEAWLKEQPPETEVAIDSQWVKARKMADAAYRVAGPLINARSAVKEVDRHWTCPYTGIPCRGIFDLDLVTAAGRIVADLKTTGDVDRWERSRRKLHYWIQEQHYLAGARSGFGGGPVVFCYIVVDHSGRGFVSEVSAAVEEGERDRYRRLMESFATCLESDEWPERLVETSVAAETPSEFELEEVW
jgi:exodeoxyribonuclease VIII